MRTATALLMVATVATAQTSDTIIKRVGAPRYPGMARLVPEVRIGGDVADTLYQFDKLYQMLGARDGSVWVLENHNGEVMSFIMGGGGTGSGYRLSLFGADGKLIRRVGRHGSGPGEWSIPNSLYPLPDGRVLVLDGSQGHRLTFYRANGLLDTVWTMPTRYSFGGVDTAGFLWLQPTAMRPAGTRGGLGSLVSPPKVILDQKGSVIREAPVVPRAPRVLAGQLPMKDGRSGPERPYMPRSFQAWSPHGYSAIGVTDQYIINFYRPMVASAKGFVGWSEGDPILSLRRDVPLINVTEDEKRDLRGFLSAAAKWNGGALASTPAIPSVKPPLTRVQFDVEGRLWVGVSVPSERGVKPRALPQRKGPPYPSQPWREPDTFDVYESDLTYVGRVQFPINARSLANALNARGNYIWLVETDENDFEAVVRYRIDWR